METPLLKLPLIAAAQAQKHVTVNEALMDLDALAQIGVESATTIAAPAAPAEQQRYIVPAGATGVWSAQAGRLALFQDGGWRYIAPLLGWSAYVRDSDRVLVFDGVGWRAPNGGASAGGIATSDVILRVPEDHATVQAALDALHALRFAPSARGVIDIAPGVHALLAPLRSAHPQPGRILLRGRNPATAVTAAHLGGGRSADEAAVRARFPVQLDCAGAEGVALADGAGFALQDIALIRQGAAGTSVGIRLDRNGVASLTRVAVVGFHTGLRVGGGSVATLGPGVGLLHCAAHGLSCAEGGEALGDGPLAAYNAGSQADGAGKALISLAGGQFIGGSTGLSLSGGAVADMRNLSVSGAAGNGVVAINGACLTLQSASVGNVGVFPIAAVGGATVIVNQVTVSGANRTVWSSNGALCHQTGPHVGTPVFSPAIGAVGNGNAYTA